MDGVFWPAGTDPEGYTTYRIPGDSLESQRDIDLIPMRELENLLIAVTRQQFGLPREDLFKEAARILSMSRVTDRVRDQLELVLDQVLRKGELKSAGNSITVPNLT